MKILIIPLLFNKCLVTEAPFSKSYSDESQPTLKIVSHQENQVTILAPTQNIVEVTISKSCSDEKSADSKNRQSVSEATL